MDEDSIHFKPNCLLVLETGIKLMNQNPPAIGLDEAEEAQEDISLQPDSQVQAKISHFTIFLNSKRTTLSEIIP
jgi:hypothetical protein